MPYWAGKERVAATATQTAMGSSARIIANSGSTGCGSRRRAGARDVWSQEYPRCRVPRGANPKNVARYQDRRILAHGRPEATLSSLLREFTPETRVALATRTLAKVTKGGWEVPSPIRGGLSWNAIQRIGRRLRPATGF